MVTPDSSQSYEARARLGLYQKASLRKYGFQWGYLLSLMPPKLRGRFGIVTDHEIDVVLDASGFAYGNQWATGQHCVSPAKSIDGSGGARS